MAKQADSRGWLGYLTALFFLSLSLLAVKEMRLGTASFAVQDPMEAAVHSLTFPDRKQRLRDSYTGIVGLDFGLRYLVSAFLPGVAGWDKGFQIQQIYFLISVFTIISIWSVEAGRKRNSIALTSLTSIWALFYQTVGGAIIIPLYYLAYMRESAQPDYWSPASRQVPVPYAKALLPSLLIGYLLPTILMYLPFSDPDLSITQAIVALWQPTPLIVNLLIYTISTVYGKGPVTSKKVTSAPPDDLKYLNRVYLTCFAVTAVTHFGIILQCLSSADPHMSLTYALGRVPVSDQMSMTEGLHYIFQADFWIIFTAALAGTYLTLWDLQRIGKTDLSLTYFAAGMTVAVIFVGPAATIAGVWYIREQILARKDKR